MFETFFRIDGDPYIALFLNECEAGVFMNDVERDGSTIELVDIQYASPKRVLENPCFEWSYKMEMLAALFFGIERHFEKWTECESALKEIGVI